jgi:hypothetical protein
LRRFGALCCGSENSFSSCLSSQIFFAANDSVGGKRKIPEMVMAKASREVDSLPMIVKRSAQVWVASRLRPRRSQIIAP